MLAFQSWHGSLFVVSVVIVITVTGVGITAWSHAAGLVGLVTASSVGSSVLLFRVVARQFRRLSVENALSQQTVATLRHSESRAIAGSRMFEAALEHIDLGLMMIDSERVVAICNRRAIELLDLPPALMAARPKFDDVLAFQWQQDEFAASDVEFRSFVQRGLLLDGPPIYDRKRPNGRVLEVRTTRFPEGEAVRTFADVTERRQTLEALAVAKELAEGGSRAKSEFLANISHELRTPLHAIIGFSDLIREQTSGPVNATYISYADDINASGKHLLHIVNNVLGMSKIEAGRYDLVEETVKLGKLLRVCQRMIMPQAEAANVRISYDPGLADVTLLIDRRAVIQVMANLLSNAVKFSPAGSSTLVCAEEVADGGVAILVRDSGIGIEPAAMRFLFEPFHQPDIWANRKFGGTGLGLAISRRLMVLHGGGLEIASQPEAGTTVRAIFPAARVVRHTPVTTGSIAL